MVIWWQGSVSIQKMFHVHQYQSNYTNGTHLYTESKLSPLILKFLKIDVHKKEYKNKEVKRFR